MKEALILQKFNIKYHHFIPDPILLHNEFLFWQHKNDKQCLASKSYHSMLQNNKSGLSPKLLWH
jgi:hypothetical protein